MLPIPTRLALAHWAASKNYMADQHDHAEHPHRLKEDLHKHLQEIPKKLKEIPYNLEQRPPNKPSFLTVVLISGAAIIVIFILALIALHAGGFGLRRSLSKHPSSQLILPSAPSRSRIA